MPRSTPASPEATTARPTGAESDGAEAPAKTRSGSPPAPPKKAETAKKAPAKGADVPAKAPLKKAPAKAAPSKKAEGAKKTEPAKKPAQTAKTAGAKTAVSKKAGETKAEAAKKPAAGKKTAAKAPEAPAKKAPAKKPAANKPAEAAPAKKAPGPVKATAKAAHPPKVEPAETALGVDAPAASPPTASTPAAPAAPRRGLGMLGQSQRPVPAVDASHLSDSAWLASQRELLGQERSVYTAQAEALKAEADAMVVDMEPGDIQFDEESGEGGTINVDRERDLALSAQARAAVEEIDAALAKLDSGTYGHCTNCGEAIARERLEAIPYAQLCVRCKSGGLSRR